MKKADSNGVRELGRATDFGSGLSATSKSSWLRVHEVRSTSSGPRARASYRFRIWPLRYSKRSWLRVHDVGSTSSGPRDRVHELGPANDFGAGYSDSWVHEGGSTSSGPQPISEHPMRCACITTPCYDGAASLPTTPPLDAYITTYQRGMSSASLV